ncbi:MAG: hypothetical protein QNK37_35365, partial [Acidobacteriota bacterium]|nr:hypothetical protein [Acidobacteriota bacterium]
MISHRPGRPMRYTKLIHNLEDRTLYSVDRIVRLGMRTGFLTQDHFAQDGLATARRRAFDALTKFRIAHLAADPDGTVVNRDDVPRPAWYGCRWKLALPVSYFPDPGTRTDLEALLTELETGNPQNPNVSTDGDREPRTVSRHIRVLWIARFQFGQQGFQVGSRSRVREIADGQG